nr:MAG TPA: hypothetical protein [Caudoviricetes sp.]
MLCDRVGVGVRVVGMLVCSFASLDLRCVILHIDTFREGH